MNKCKSCGKTTEKGDFCCVECKTDYRDSMNPATFRGIDEEDHDKPFISWPWFLVMVICLVAFFILFVLANR